MKTRIFIVILMIIFCSSLYGQVQVGQGINDFYQKAPEFHNLALLPLHSVPAVSLFGNTRMDGFEKHPMNASLLCSGFLIDHLGAGLKINYQTIGLSTQTDIQLGLAYYVFLSKPTDEKKGGDKFSFFLAGNFTLDGIQKKNILVIYQNDPMLDAIRNFNPSMNASAGIAFLRENKYYAGVSANQLFPTETNFGNPILENKKERCYYFLGSYIFPLSQKKNLDLEVNGIGSTSNFSYWEWQASLDFRFLKMFSLGTGVKSNGCLKFNLGITAQSWDFGYMCGFGLWNPSTAHTYQSMENGIFVRKIFNEGRRNKK
ncbi:MAG: type IX secretion system membrane protein PorP/SprF [Patescibacteria group bacterium]